MAKYSVFICISCIVCSIVKLLVPPGNMTKTMNKVIGLLAIFLFIFPFKRSFGKLKLNLKKFENSYSPKSNNALVDSLELQASGLASEKIKSLLESKLKNINVVPKKIEIFMDTNPHSCILMIRCKIYLDKKYSSLKTQILDDISREFNIQAEIVDQ